MKFLIIKLLDVFDKFTPAKDVVDKVKNIFVRYAARNGKELSDLQAQSIVDDILEQAKNSFPTIDRYAFF
jgi:hypothetical protein